MKTNKQKIILFLKVLLVLFVGIILFTYIFRDIILNRSIAKVTAKMEFEYNSNFTVKKASFEGFSGLSLTELSLTPKNADTLLHIKKLKTSINVLKLLIGEIQLGTLTIEDGFVQLVQKGDVKNFAAFLKKDDKEPTDNSKKNYAEIAYRIISKVLNLVPTDMKLENLIFKLDDNDKKATIKIDNLILQNKKLETAINIKTSTYEQRWKINGYADPREKKADLRFFNLDTGAIKVPYLDERYNLIASFDSIRLKIDNINRTDSKLHIDGFTSIANLKLNHPRIARKDVIIKNAKFDYRFLLGADFISVDSSSMIQLNKIKFHPHIAYETTQDTLYTLKIRLPKTNAQDFIHSLPSGLFTNFQGMEAIGTFDYNLDFQYNKNKPKDLIFESKLRKEKLQITKYGKANLNKLNSEFVYSAIIKDILQRPIVVGNSNPNFTPLNQISPYLQKSVLTTEDPSFFSHRGFINEAFKQSIIKNIKTKKFSRGASTISMQLVKNVFLTREKTLSRKLEEILLVYILENNRIASKERMLEVYFNVIEWGPNIYGISEASRFYFDKTPYELDLKECLFLARIIPSPNKFMYQFNDEGLLREFALQQESFLTNIMTRRGLLSLEDTVYKQQILNISGVAKSYLKLRVKDSTVIDSILQLDDFSL